MALFGSSSSGVTLTNEPNAELRDSGPFRNGDLYPFFDHRLRDKYDQLWCPESAQLVPASIADLRNAGYRTSALAGVKLNVFRQEGDARWPFGETKVVYRKTPSSATTLQGIEDLGSDVAAILAAAGILPEPLHPELEDLSEEGLALLAANPPPSPALAPLPPFETAQGTSSSAASSAAQGPSASAASSAAQEASASAALSAVPVCLAASSAAQGPSDSAASSAAPASQPASSAAPVRPAAPNRPVPQPPEERVRSRTFRLKLNADQRKHLSSWRKAARASYNKTVELIRSGRPPNNFDLYKDVTNNTCDFVRENEFLKSAPAVVRRGAVDDACAAQQGQLTLQEHRRYRQQGQLRFRSWQDDVQHGFSLTLQKDGASFAGDQGKRGSLFLKIMPKFTAKSLFEVRLRRQCSRDFFESLFDPTTHQPERSFLLQRDRYGHWNLVLRYTLGSDGQRVAASGGSRAKGKQKKPRETAKPAETSESGRALTLPPCPRVMGIDPGARTAWTVYTSDGFLIELGVKEDAKTLSDLRVRAAKVESQLTARKPWRNLNKGQRDRGLVRPYLTHGRDRARLRRKKARILARHSQLVQNMHQRVSSFLAHNADVVIMPRMQSTSMVQRPADRPAVLKRPTKSTLLAWGHCKFVDRLTSKAQDQRCALLEQPEGYTTKTCGRCGLLHPSVGADEVFKCPTCGLRSPRDGHAARNMVIKAIRRPVP